MKKKFNVMYAVTTSYDAVVQANNKKQAEEKVREVIGDPLVIESVVELKGDK